MEIAAWLITYKYLQLTMLANNGQL
jgi:hypothetical protein